MPDATWMTTGGAATVGTATVTDAGDLLTLTAHGLVNGQLVYTSGPTGGGTALVSGAPYWVASAAANTFQLRPSPGGPVMAFAADGTVSVQTAAAEYSDAELRRLDLPLMWPGATGAQTVSGVRPGHPAVSLSGTTVTFGPCAGVTSAVTAPWSSTSGPYRWMLTAENVSLTPADGSQPRIDRLVARIQDTTVDATGARQAVGAVKVGTPAAVPVAPGVVAGEVSLGTVLVPAGGAPLPSLTLDAADLTALGGTKPVANAAGLPSTGRYAGMRCYIISEAAEVVWDGSTWLDVRPGMAPAKVSVGANEIDWTNTAPAAGSTLCGVTFTAPRSGRVWVHHGGSLQSVSGTCQLGIYVRSGSTIGSGTIIYNGDFDGGGKLIKFHANAGGGGATNLITGLTGGSTYNVHTIHWVSAGGTGRIWERWLTVGPA